MLKRLLIANRGEIACRIHRTAKKMGIETVAIYTPPDYNSNHTKLADIAVPLQLNTDYLNKDRILEICKKYDVDSVHPGYGFLSENAQFATMLEKHEIKWVGPPGNAIMQMGSKSVAKRIMSEANVPVTPGYFGENQDPEHLLNEAKKIKFPVLIKAVNGGGGKGMRIVHNESDFIELLQSCQREAKNSFGNDKVLIEKYILAPRHIEVQIFADNHENCVYLFERDCSVQRRHQKIIEEAPAPHLSEELRKELGETAVRAAKAVNYSGAGTVEFIFDTTSNDYYFMEMNTRLQVEHPVTELITGLDLVEWQLNIAQNKPLPLSQGQIKRNGHAFEARIYAENPYNNFMPDSGTLVYYKEPNTRVDTYLSKNDTISVHYDPMISKVIVHDQNRSSALVKLLNHLKSYDIIGVHTNLNFLKQLCANDNFKSFKAIDTNFIKNNPKVLESPYKVSELFDAYMISALVQSKSRFNYSSNVPRTISKEVDSDIPLDSRYTMKMTIGEEISIEFKNKKETHTFQNCQITMNDDSVYLSHNEHKKTYKLVDLDQHFVITQNGVIYGVKEVKTYNISATVQSVNDIKAPMPSKVIKVLVKEGDSIKIGQSLLVVEAMKMEHVIKSTLEGKVEKVSVKENELVNDKKTLMVLK